MFSVRGTMIFAFPRISDVLIVKLVILLIRADLVYKTYLKNRIFLIATYMPTINILLRVTVHTKVSTFSCLNGMSFQGALTLVLGRGAKPFPPPPAKKTP